jgi:hypothetical protein
MLDSIQESGSLNALGRELDEARSRRGQRSRQSHDNALEASPTLSELSLSDRSSKESTTDAERPFPLCLLCYARPPTAVLLPCEYQAEQLASNHIRGEQKDAINGKDIC